MEAGGERTTTIVLYPSPGKNHLSPVVELGKLLAKQSPSISVTIITSSQPHESQALQSHTHNLSTSNPSLNFIHLSPPPSQNGHCKPHLDPQFTTHEHVASLFELPRLNNPRLGETLLEISKTSNLKALVIDFFSSFASHVSSDLGIPTYYLRTQGAFAVSMLLHCPTIDRTIPQSLKEVDVLVTPPGVPPIPSKDMPVVLCDRSHRVYRYFIEGSTQLRKSKGIILNTFEGLEAQTLQALRQYKCREGGEDDVFPPLYCVGPLLSGGAPGSTSIESKDECLIWLDSQPSRSVLFLCFGRFGILSRKQLLEMAIALEKSGVRFLWVVRTAPEEGNNPDEIDLERLFPDGFLERTKEKGLVVKMWAPQMAVLNHGSVGGFVSHCGWSSVMEAVWAGVPILAWPLYAEQKMNGVCLVEGIKVAIGIREGEDGFVTAQELEEGVTELMNTERGKIVSQKALDMREAAHKATCEGGSSRLALAKLIDSFLS